MFFHSVSALGPAASASLSQNGSEEIIDETSVALSTTEVGSEVTSAYTVTLTFSTEIVSTFTVQCSDVESYCLAPTQTQVAPAETVTPSIELLSFIIAPSRSIDVMRTTLPPLSSTHDVQVMPSSSVLEPRASLKIETSPYPTTLDEVPSAVILSTSTRSFDPSPLPPPVSTMIRNVVPDKVSGQNEMTRTDETAATETIYSTQSTYQELEKADPPPPPEGPIIVSESIDPHDRENIEASLTTSNDLSTSVVLSSFSSITPLSQTVIAVTPTPTTTVIPTVASVGTPSRAPVRTRPPVQRTTSKPSWFTLPTPFPRYHCEIISYNRLCFSSLDKICILVKRFVVVENEIRVRLYQAGDFKDYPEDLRVFLSRCKRCKKYVG